MAPHRFLIGWAMVAVGLGIFAAITVGPKLERYRAEQEAIDQLCEETRRTWGVCAGRVYD